MYLSHLDISDDKTLVQIAKKHDAKGYYHINDMVASLKKQVEIGLPFEMEHTKDEKIALEIVKDHLWEDPNYYSKLTKAGLDEKKIPHDSDDDTDDVFPKGSSDWRKKKETKEKEEVKETEEAGEVEPLDVPVDDIPF